MDDLTVEVLGMRNPEIHAHALNNSCMVVRVQGRKSILFLGDLEADGSRKLLAGPYGSRVKADYVQMAHHGQTGVDEDVYRAVAPECCLWPTPRWLWENNTTGAAGSGPWTTLETRGWMEKLGVRRHVVAMDGVGEVQE